MSASITVPQLPSSVPFPIPDEQLADVVVKAKDWALMHGAGMRSKTNFNPNVIQVKNTFYSIVFVYNIRIFQFAPFILTPTAFPRREFEKAVGLQTILNELMHWVAHDVEFLRDTLANTIKVDAFTGRLFEIYERSLAEGIGQVGDLIILTEINTFGIVVIAKIDKPQLILSRSYFIRDDAISDDLESSMFCNLQSIIIIHVTIDFVYLFVRKSDSREHGYRFCRFVYILLL